MANNEVLAGLKAAYLATEDEQVRNGIIKAWAEETNEILAYSFMYDAKIRAWQPEQPDPLAEMTRRVATLERGLATLSATVQGIDVDVSALKANAPLPAPDPDDPVCARDGCGHPKSQHNYRGGACDYLPCHCPAFLPAPPAEPPLDPVLVAIRELYVLLERGSAMASLLRNEWRERSSEPRNFDFLQLDAAIRAYGVSS